MYNLLISVGASAAVFGLVLVVFGAWEAILPAVIVFIGAYIFLARRTGVQLQALMAEVTADLQAQRFDKAIARMKTGMALGKWQFLVEGQLAGHTGTIMYTLKQFKEAMPYLEQAPGNHWAAKGMLAVQAFREKRYEDAKALFEKAVAANKKQSLLWAVYAYTLWQQNQNEAALDVLVRGLKQNPDDERLKTCHLALQNGKKLKMKHYGEQWYQFHLEAYPVQKIEARHHPFMHMRVPRRMR